MKLHIFLLTALALLLASCVSFSGGAGGPLFSMDFRDTSSFPDADPFNNVLLLDVAETARPFPVNASIQIDGHAVQVLTLTQGGRTEVSWPPAGWARTAGEHEVEVTLRDQTRTLPFTWHD